MPGAGTAIRQAAPAGAISSAPLARLIRRGPARPRDCRVFSVTPVKVFAHAKGDPFGATTHRFGRDG
jgi:hypothetical protein